MTRIALATCADLPGSEVDDRPLHEALVRRGVDCPQVVWDDPSVDWGVFDACVIRTTWDYQEKRDAYLEWAERVERHAPLFNPASIVRWNTHKSYLRDLETRGVPVVTTAWLDAGRVVDVAALLAERGWRHAFIKPAIGATARETMRFTDTPDDLARAQAHVERLLPNEDLLLQPYLGSVEREGELSVVFIDGRISHAVRKTPPAGDYRVQDDFGGRDEPVSLSGAEAGLARRAVAAANGNLLYARADFLRDDEGEWCLTELELVEPLLFLRHAPGAAETLAEAICRRLPG